MKYPPLTAASLVSYNHLNPFSEVVPAEKMAELERKILRLENSLNVMLADDNTPHDAYLACFHLALGLKKP